MTADLPDWCDRLAVFDLETTGVDVDADRIVTASVALLDATGAVIHEETWLADPGVPIPEGAAEVHGVSTDHAREHGRPAAEVVGGILDALGTIVAGGIPVVAFNAAFDFSMLAAEAERYGHAPLDDRLCVIDPFLLDKEHDTYRRGKRTLGAVAEVYGVTLTDAHDASADALAAGRIAYALLRLMAADLPDRAPEFHARQARWAREQAEEFTNYLRRAGRMGPEESIDGRWPLRRG